MNILYCGDANILDGLIISLLSILKYEKSTLNVYILTMNYDNKKMITLKMLEKIKQEMLIANPESTITIINMEQYFTLEPPTANLDTIFTPYCMLRLYADLVEELPNKILYLDNDVVANKNFREFYDIDNSQYEVVGVRDFYGKYFYSKNKITKDYLNSGVLLLNLDLIKKNKTFLKARALCQNKKMLLPDQAALNKFCKHKLILPRKYNEQHSLKKNTIFRHFTTTFKFFPYVRTQKVKPWEIDKMHTILKCYEFDDILTKYLQLKENNNE